MLFFFNIFSIVNTGLKYFIGLDKDLCRYGRNTQIFFWLFLRKTLLMHIKTEGMTQFDIFHTFVQN